MIPPRKDTATIIEVQILENDPRGEARVLLEAFAPTTRIKTGATVVCLSQQTFEAMCAELQRATHHALPCDMALIEHKALSDCALQCRHFPSPRAPEGLAASLETDDSSKERISFDDE